MALHFEPRLAQCGKRDQMPGSDPIDISLTNVRKFSGLPKCRRAGAMSAPSLTQIIPSASDANKRCTIPTRLNGPKQRTPPSLVWGRIHSFYAAA
jgi:hypothetical protein